MNRYPRWSCRLERWAKRPQGTILPGVLGNVPLAGELLEIGPGPSIATAWLRERFARVTAIGITNDAPVPHER